MQDDAMGLPFFNPQGVAIIGASHHASKLGFGLVRNLVQSDYSGAIHLVNPQGGRLFQRPLYRSVAEVPDPVDLAVLLIPAPQVPQVLAACGERGIRAAIIASGGFRETGPEGAELEAQCVQIARQYGMRFLGPNCIGILDTHLPMDVTFLPPPGPTPGGVAFLSHSGAICAAVIDWARGQGFGLSRMVSLGNQADLQECDLLPLVAADPHTRVITLYLEGVRDGQRLVEVARRISRSKPIVALKVGRTARSQAAIASHTGALAGEVSAFRAAMQHAGVICAEHTEELFDWARALAWCPLPVGRKVAVLTNAGGPGIAATDALLECGLTLADLAEETASNLRALLPPAASVQNPVDMLASASPAQYAECLALLLADPGVHSVMIILPPPPLESAGAVARALIPVIQIATKPVVVALMGEHLIQEAAAHFRAAQVPEYRFPERAASALEVLAERSETLAYECPLPPRPSAVRPEWVRAFLATVLPTGDFLPPEFTDQLLAAYGIPTPAGKLVYSPCEAVEVAQQLGFPVALKVVSPQLVHKSDVGGILLGLESTASVAHGYTSLLEQVARARPEAAVTGVYVQRMVPAGQEVILGALRDPQFGPLVMFGSGGVEVEGLRDVAFALAPLTEEAAERLLERTWAGRRLHGYRHLPPADRAAVISAMLHLGQLIAEIPEVVEIEINPLRVLAQGGGALALDGRARLLRREVEPVPDGRLAEPAGIR